MEKKRNDVNVFSVYAGSILTSFVTFMLTYILISEMFVSTIYFSGIQKALDMSTVLLAYLLQINLTTMIMYRYDKFKAVSGWGMRVPEIVLHLLEALGGSFGALVSQRLFRHKRRKTSFYKITWMIVVLQVTFLSLPVLVQLPRDLQLIIFGIVLLILVLLYFIDAAIFLLSSMYSLVLVTAIGYGIYYLLVK